MSNIKIAIVLIDKQNCPFLDHFWPIFGTKGSSLPSRTAISRCNLKPYKRAPDWLLAYKFCSLIICMSNCASTYVERQLSFHLAINPSNEGLKQLSINRWARRVPEVSLAATEVGCGTCRLKSCRIRPNMHRTMKADTQERRSSVCEPCFSERDGSWHDHGFIDDSPFMRSFHSRSQGFHQLPVKLSHYRVAAQDGFEASFAPGTYPGLAHFTGLTLRPLDQLLTGRAPIHQRSTY